MKREVILTPDAQVDLWRLDDFLASRNPKAAERAMQDIQSAVASLDEMAERGRPTRTAGIRELVVPFGSAAYIVTYRVETDRVLVTRLHHSREAR